MKETKISLTLEPRKEKFNPFNNFIIIRENKNSKQKMGGI